MDRIVVVTGTSQGIGRDTAEAFARAGDTVVATSRRVEPDETPLAVGSGRIVRAALDVTDGDAVTAFAAEVLERHGRIDVVVNNAGQGFTGSTEELSVDDVQRSLDVNFLGTLRLTKAFLPSMRAAGRGHLIALSSIGGAVGQPFTDAYSAAKFALEGLYESLHPVAAAAGVRVVLIQPGPVQTDHRNRAVQTSTVPELAELKSTFVAMMDATFAHAPDGTKVADMIVAVADDPAAKLRYQTSRLVSHLVGLKLADLSGDAITSLTASWLVPATAGPDPS